MKRTFGVRLEGTDCWLPIRQRGGFRLRPRVVEQLHGFYTTRFVQATSPEEAARMAEALVADELRAIVANGERPFGIAVEEVWEHSDAAQGTGSGFTWYGLDKPRMRQNQAQ